MAPLAVAQAFVEVEEWRVYADNEPLRQLMRGSAQPGVQADVP
jgi:hypothetical protein